MFPQPQLDPGSDVPLYRQLCSQMREWIRSGRLATRRAAPVHSGIGWPAWPEPDHRHRRLLPARIRRPDPRPRGPGQLRDRRGEAGSPRPRLGPAAGRAGRACPRHRGAGRCRHQLRHLPPCRAACSRWRRSAPPAARCWRARRRRRFSSSARPAATRRCGEYLLAEARRAGNRAVSGRHPDHQRLPAGARPGAARAGPRRATRCWSRTRSIPASRTCWRGPGASVVGVPVGAAGHRRGAPGTRAGPREGRGCWW